MDRLSREEIFQKYGRKLEKVVFRLPDNTQHDFYIKNESMAVAIVALTPDSKVVLVERYRPGPKKVLLEIPGGGVEKGEDILTATKRELLEETGYTGDFECVGPCYQDAYCTSIHVCVVAQNCKQITQPSSEATEFLHTKLLSLESFRKHLQSGELTDTDIGYLALDHLHLL